MQHKIIRSVSNRGIAYSVFAFGSSRHMFLVGEPETYQINFGDVPGQIQNLLENVKAVCQELGFVNVPPAEEAENENGEDDIDILGANTVVAMCHIFLADIGMRELVRQRANEMCPHIFDAVTFVPQSPASGAAVAIELWAMTGKEPHFVRFPECEFAPENDESGDDEPDEKMFPHRHVVCAEFDDMRWLFCGGADPGTSPAVGAYKRSCDAFTRLDDLIAEGGFSFEQILRTWIYQGHLVLSEGANAEGIAVQRYQELNRARTDCFDGIQFLQHNLPEHYAETHERPVYPASTGIGADDFDVVLSAIAFDTNRDDVIVVPLENPNQTSAFHYDEEYSPQSPKFSRAMAVAAADTCLIFVSGTASITDSESRHIDDPVMQTEQTLDNIAGLIAGENLALHGIEGMSCSLSNLESVRVYVKRRAELDVVRQVCGQRLPNVPTLYVIADICRPELLVEIEGIAVTRR